MHMIIRIFLFISLSAVVKQNTSALTVCNVFVFSTSVLYVVIPKGQLYIFLDPDVNNVKLLIHFIPFNCTFSNYLKSLLHCVLFTISILYYIVITIEIFG